MGKQFKASTKLTAKFLVALLVLQAVLFSLTAFAVVAPPTPDALTIKKAGIAVADGATLPIYTGAVVPFTASFTKAGTSVVNAVYTTAWSKTGGISVSTTGVVTASTTTGAATLIATSTTPNLSDTVTFWVYKELKLAAFILPATMKVSVSKTVYIPASHGDADVTDTVYSFVGTTAATTTDIVTLDTVSGAVYAKKSGTVSIKVTKTQPIGNIKISKNITITVPEPVKTVEISTNGTTPAGATIGINAGVKTTLKAIVTSNTGSTKKATDPTVKWAKVSGDSAITIDANTGVITLTDTIADAAIGKTAVISVTANDTWNNAADTITVTVGKALVSVTAVKSVLLLKAGDNKTIIPVLKSNNTTAPTLSVTGVTYTAEPGKTAILTVNSITGVVYAVAAGATTALSTVKITVEAFAADGTSKKTIVSATVVANVTNIVLTQPETTKSTKPLSLYSKALIKTTITPASLKLNMVRYTSSDPTIAFVNKYTGEITAAGVGHATITASADGFTSNAIDVYVANPDGL
jgi:hypothetical protein